VDCCTDAELMLKFSCLVVPLAGFYVYAQACKILLFPASQTLIPCVCVFVRVCMRACIRVRV